MKDKNGSLGVLIYTILAAILIILTTCICSIFCTLDITYLSLKGNGLGRALDYLVYVQEGDCLVPTRLNSIKLFIIGICVMLVVELFIKAIYRILFKSKVPYSEDIQELKKRSYINSLVRWFSLILITFVFVCSFGYILMIGVLKTTTTPITDVALAQKMMINELQEIEDTEQTSFTICKSNIYHKGDKEIKYIIIGEYKYALIEQDTYTYTFSTEDKTKYYDLDTSITEEVGDSDEFR